MNNTLLELVRSDIDAYIVQIGLRDIKYNVTYIDHLKFGHIATNFALVVARLQDTSPLEVAENLCEYLGGQKIYVTASVAGAGFVNVKLNTDVLVEAATKTVKAKHQWNGLRVLVEYTDPNPFKPFHIGHLMANAVGEFCARALEEADTKVVRLCYPGDVGRHIAMSLYGMDMNVATRPSDELSLTLKVSWLGECYRTGFLAFTESEEAKEKILALNEQVYSNSLPSPYDVYYEEGRALSFASHQDMYARLGTAFDGYIYESEAAPIGLVQVRANTPGIFEESEGAIVYKGEQDGLHTRVFVNSKGLPTYEAKDVGNMQLKIDRYSPFDYSLVVTANEQNEYFKVLYKALGKLHPMIDGKLAHIGHGIMRFADGKMSSRKGTVIEAEDLLTTISETLVDTFSNKKIPHEVQTRVAVGVLKFAVLKQSTGSDVVFDFEKMMSLSGDSAPYIMYTYSRFLKLAKSSQCTGCGVSVEISQVLLALARADDCRVAGVLELAPQHLVTGLLVLCREVNAWYANDRILGDVFKMNVAYLICKRIQELCHVLAIPLVVEM